MKSLFFFLLTFALFLLAPFASAIQVQLQSPELALSVIATDATRAREFYSESLGMTDKGEAQNPPPGLHMYLYGSGQATLKVRVYDTDPPGRDPALLAENGLRFITIPVSDFDGALTRLAARGFSAPTVQTSGGVRTGMAVDGDGNVVEMIDAATAPTRKLEIGIITDATGIAAAQSFYATTMGLPTAAAVAGPSPVPGSTEYRYKANNTVLRFFGPPGTRTTPTDAVGAIRGYRYITFTVTKDVDILYDQMVAAGAPIASPLAQHGTTAMLFIVRGPGGALHEFVGPPHSEHTAFTDMVFTKDYYAPGEAVGSAMSETLEALALEPHKGRLFCSTSYVGPSGTTASANPKVLVKDTAASPWRVDYQMGDVDARIPILRSVNFTTDGAGNVLTNAQGQPQPVPVLIAGTGQWRAWFNENDPNRYGVYVLSRDDANNTWVRHKLYHTPWNPLQLNHANEVRMLADHYDAVTGVHYVFAFSQSGRVFRGWYDPNVPGKVAWAAQPEFDNTYGLGLCATECNGTLYVGMAFTPNGNNPPVLPRPSTNFGLWRRIDGIRNPVDLANPPATNAQWEWISIPEWQVPGSPGDSLYSGQFRGLSAIPDPKGGTHDVLAMHWDSPDSKLYVVDPMDNHQATLELETRTFIRSLWGNTAGAITVGYNDWQAATHPDTGENVQLVSSWLTYPGGELNSPEAKSSYFLVRYADAAYSVVRIWDPANALGGAAYGLRGCRSIRPSPFPNEAGRVWYFCGFDLTGISGGDDVSGPQGWIYKGTIGTVPPLSTSLAASQDVAREVSAVTLAQPLMGTVSAAVFGKVDAASAMGGALSIVATPAWQHRQNGAVNLADAGLSLSLGANGEVFAGGRSIVSGTTSDAAALRYSPADGTPIWTRTANGPGNNIDEIFATVATPDGGVAGIGRSIGAGTGSDVAIWKWSADGTLSWTYRYNGPATAGADFGRAIAVRPDGSLAFAGYSPGVGTGANDWVVGAVSATGTELWVNRYNGPGNADDQAASVCVDSSGNVFATGYHLTTASTSSRDLLLLKYNADGTFGWQASYNFAGGGDWGVACACDANGDIFVGGYSVQAATDFVTLRYAPDGTARWATRYNGPVTGSTGNDVLRALTLMPDGGVAVCGSSPGVGTGDDWAIVRYNSSGVQQWAARLAGTTTTGNDIPYSIAADQAGNLYAAGSLANTGAGNDYAVARFDTDGVLAWKWEYNGPSGTDDVAQSLRVNKAGEVFATGWSTSSTGTDIYTVKLAQTLRYTPPAGFTGADTFNVTLVDDQGRVVSTLVQTTVWSPPAIVEVSGTALSGNSGTNYSLQLTGSGGVGPYNWTLAAGSLPPGVTLSAGGLLSGTPTSAGTFNLTVRVTDSLGGTSTMPLSMTIFGSISFTVDDVPVGTGGISYADPEFLSPVNRMVFQTGGTGVQEVWVAELNPLTGLLVSATGKDLLVDTGAATIGPNYDTTNGPEWGLDSEGAAIFYSKRDANDIVQFWRASNLVPGAVNVTQLTHVPGPNGEGAIMGIARKDASRPTTQFIYRYIQAPRFQVPGPARWADETAPDAINDFPQFNGAAAAPSWIEGTEDFLYAKIVSAGRSELATFNTATATATVWTSDPGAKYNVQAITAPELNGELLLGCVIDRLRFTVFRFNGTSYVPWANLAPPDPAHPYMLSPEVFQVNGMTYVAVQMSSNNPDNIGGLPPGTDCAMWILNLGADPAKRFARRVDEGAITGAIAYRLEPEWYIGTHEVFLYYNLGNTLRRARTGVFTKDIPDMSFNLTGASTGKLQMGFTRPGFTYQLETSTTLTGWTNHGPAFPGDGNAKEINLNLGGEPNRFYRLRQTEDNP